MVADELDLRSLGDDDLVQQMHDDLYDGMKIEIEEAVLILLERDWTPYRTLTEGLVEGMRIVGLGPEGFARGSSLQVSSLKQPRS
jgi:methanogenic corrinoid protein MtbC1